ncbi:MAG: undecaprenyl/decaprenyl-phosphate alpha-N-acetylglucosaminyl 1-phosphate transferase [Prevotellaceae bacterium]|jgi:UDP-N-acetylmuramyl pentapeptide phosphotransferase/UDP-N-acetylglucosamine-1-phosphate transferase|nr:undecaprenyl/decaprenyl-phosphate alpha-N-acetylglucosaminyl 1-phosphate transferase [Prevotellaceae bacterium]
MAFVFYCAISSFIVAFLLLPMLIKLLTKQHLLDIGGRRKIHKGFIPSMGGIAIFVGFVFSISVWIPLSDLAYYRYFCAAMILVIITGLRDDFLPMSPRGKLFMQLLAATMVVWGEGHMSIRITSLCGFLGIYELPLFASYALSIFVIVVITNAFNLIDGLDGLAGLIGLIAFTFLAEWFLMVRDGQNHTWTMGLLLVALIGGIVAFLCYNWHPASIFMGDTGSLLLGFILSVSIIKFLQTSSSPAFVSDYRFSAPLSMAIAFVIIPLFDTGRIFLLRLSQGRSPFLPDKLHIHHLLMRMGLSHSQVTMVMGVLHVLLLGIIYLASQRLSDNFLIPSLVLLCVGLHFLLDYIVNAIFHRRRNRVRESITVVTKE